MAAEDPAQISLQLMEVSRVFLASVSLDVGDFFDFGLNDMNKIHCLLDPLLLTIADFNNCTTFSHFRGPVNIYAQ